MDRWLLLEPYYGGSHRHLADGLARRLPFPLELWTLPPRKWKWRMRSAAVVFARRWAAEAERLAGVRGILASSLLDAAALRGLLPPAARNLPLLLYCHENQLAYPVQVDDRRDYQYAWTNIQSALAADRVLWNSAYNRDSFLEELPRFVRRMPDARPRRLAAAVAERSEVLPVPLAVAEIESTAARLRREDEAAGASVAEGPAAGAGNEEGVAGAAPERSGAEAEPVGASEGRTGAEHHRSAIEGEAPAGRRNRPCRILWNHRWEHDKAPGAFFDALLRLADEGLVFQVAVLGQAFERRPAVFEHARGLLGDRIVAWGYRESRMEYLLELARADVVVSTARHEFQGLAVLEAAACGAVPLVPDGLAYREIWPQALRYPEGGLVETLRDRIERLDAWRRYDPRGFARPFDWGELLPRWIRVLEEAVPA